LSNEVQIGDLYSLKTEIKINHIYLRWRKAQWDIETLHEGLFVVGNAALDYIELYCGDLEDGVFTVHLKHGHLIKSSNLSLLEKVNVAAGSYELEVETYDETYPIDPFEREGIERVPS
jgi:hypothetical protein